MKGKFICFEGIEGSGKSTMLRHTEKYLNNKKIKYVITREPGGTDVGKKIRSILLSDKNKICDDTELLLMFADRAQHIHSVIQKNLLKGVNVISDRYIYASYAYQGYGRKISKNTIEILDKIFCSNISIDKCLYFDIDPKIALARIKNRRLDRFEKMNKKFFLDVHKGYKYICKKNSRKVCKIDANQNINDVEDEVIVQISKILKIS